MQYINAEKTVLLKIIALVALFNLLISSLLIIGTLALIVNMLKMSDEMLGFPQGVVALGALRGYLHSSIQ